MVAAARRAGGESLMPIFEYHCLACHTHFDRLRPATERDAPAPCPTCGAKAKRTISAFATIRVGGVATAEGPVMAGGGGCGCGGHCACGGGTSD
jgi:putative FmdB family regulatory protein